MNASWPLVLMYHGVVPDRLPVDYTRLGLLGQTEFARHMRRLRRSYHILHPDEYADCLEQERPAPQRSVLVTLDDGFQNVLDYALPAAEALEIPLLVFVSSAHLDGGEWLWFSRWRAAGLAKSAESSVDAGLPPECGSLEAIDAWLERSGAPRRATSPAAWRTFFDGMDTRQMAQAAARGSLVLGGHTVRHPKLTCESPAVIRREIAENQAFLENLTGRAVRLFAYPQGIWDESTARAVQEAGFAGAFTASPERTMVAADLAAFCLPRTGINFSGRFYFWWRRIGAGTWLRRKAGLLRGRAIDSTAHLGYD